MKDEELREEARLYFIPFILGNTPSARKLSRRIYFKYRIICLILDTKGSLLQLLDPTNRFLKLSKAHSSSLTAMQLTALAEQSAYTLPLLIPCSEKYEKLVEENRELLEKSFVISSIDTALTDSPLNIIS